MDWIRMPRYTAEECGNELKKERENMLE